MERITTEEVNAKYREFTQNKNENTLKAYKDIEFKKREQDKQDKFEAFNESIRLKNEWYLFLNSFAPKVIKVLNEYEETLSTKDGNVRASLLKLLPKHDKVRYGIRFGHLDLFYDNGSYQNNQRTTFYDYDGIYSYSECTLIDFDMEYEIANKYLEAYNEAYNKLSSMQVNHFFKTYLMETNHISKITF